MSQFVKFDPPLPAEKIAGLFNGIEHWQSRAQPGTVIVKQELTEEQQGKLIEAGGEFFENIKMDLFHP
jgi:hypothetical protein